MHGVNAYRGLSRVGKNASNARNISECDSLLIGNKCHAIHTYPYHEIRNSSANIEHEATTQKSLKNNFLSKSKGISEEDAIAMIVNGFVKRF